MRAIQTIPQEAVGRTTFKKEDWELSSKPLSLWPPTKFQEECIFSRNRLAEPLSCCSNKRETSLVFLYCIFQQNFYLAVGYLITLSFHNSSKNKTSGICNYVSVCAMSTISTDLNTSNVFCSLRCQML